MMFRRMNQARKKERKDSRTKTVRIQDAREPRTGEAELGGRECLARGNNVIAKGGEGRGSAHRGYMVERIHQGSSGAAVLIMVTRGYSV